MHRALLILATLALVLGPAPTASSFPDSLPPTPGIDATGANLRTSLPLPVGEARLSGLRDDAAARRPPVRPEAPGAGLASVRVRIPAATCHEDLVPHPPIRISQDEGPNGFILGRDPVAGTPLPRPGSGVVGGSGTAADPYVIEGWCIDRQTPVGTVWNSLRPVHGEWNGIRISGTTAHVVIRNTAVLNQAHHGVHVEGSANVSLRDNLIAGNASYGAVFLSAPGAALRDNEVSGNTGGVWVGATADAVVDGNTFSGNIVDLAVMESPSARVTGNATGTGIWMWGPQPEHFRHEIEDNTVGGKPIVYLRGLEETEVAEPAGQLLLVEATDVTVTGLEVSGAAVGIQVAHSTAVTITSNVVRDSVLEGIRIDASRDVTVEANSVSASGRDGILLWGGTRGGAVRDNAVTGNAIVGIFLGDAEGVAVHHNTVADNGFPGVMLFESSGNDIYDNVVRQNGWDGILLLDAHENDLHHNTVVDNGIDWPGIYLLVGEGNAVRHNTITGAHGWGVALQAVTGTTVIHNTVVGAAYDGIPLWESDGNEIARNALIGNTHAIRVAELLSRPSADNRFLANRIEGGEVGFVFEGRTPGTGIHDNDLIGNGRGIDASAAESELDARLNWWGSPTGPGGGATDPTTGTTADGDGDTIVPEDATVRFDPWRVAPSPDAGPG